eukprot:CAMPEP_0174743206 /NCGR_PEP_ID=MMETSP1094-20130205/81003_1 /TAXON_ID=156173 /ORGANISM="Chrysochromulina brevifilum, Strain UTEX LB 985" /LENGTH=54 /DNA_ID=CAMNT_0015947387 /DNA_START=54 /DNA_END=216 /DNA_ORIENTATION=+
MIAFRVKAAASAAAAAAVGEGSFVVGGLSASNPAHFQVHVARRTSHLPLTTYHL